LQGPVEVVKKGSIRNIQLTMEDRQGGRKHVTRVIHVESFGFDADELAGILQRKFLCGWLSTPPTGGKPIQLQKECTATAAARCPVLRKTWVAYHPNNVVYRNWNDTCHMQRSP